MSKNQIYIFFSLGIECAERGTNEKSVLWIYFEQTTTVLNFKQSQKLRKFWCMSDSTNYLNRTTSWA